MRAAKVQASLRIRAVSPEPSLLAHTSSESRGTFRQKTRSLAPLNGWTCAVEICHDGMLEDTNSLDGAQVKTVYVKEVAAFDIKLLGINPLFCSLYCLFVIEITSHKDLFIAILGPTGWLLGLRKEIIGYLINDKSIRAV